MTKPLIEIVPQDDPRAVPKDAPYQHLDGEMLIVLVDGVSAALYDSEGEWCWPYDGWRFEDEMDVSHEMQFRDRDEAIRLLSEKLVREPVY